MGRVAPDIRPLFDIRYPVPDIWLEKNSFKLKTEDQKNYNKTYKKETDCPRSPFYIMSKKWKFIKNLYFLHDGHFFQETRPQHDVNKNKNYRTGYKYL